MGSRKIFAILEILLSTLGKMFHSSPIITFCLYVNGVSYHSWFIVYGSVRSTWRNQKEACKVRLMHKKTFLQPGCKINIVSLPAKTVFYCQQGINEEASVHGHGGVGGIDVAARAFHSASSP